jgi:hypothetical protein
MKIAFSETMPASYLLVNRLPPGGNDNGGAEMKRPEVLTLIAVVVFSVPALAPAADGPARSLEIVIPSGQFQVESGEHGNRIFMEGFGFRAEPGKPMLPERRILIALPPGARATGVTAEGIGAASLLDVGRIEPAPPIVPMSDRKLAVTFKTEWDATVRAVYSSDDAFPGQIARMKSSGSLRKYAYASVSVCPVRYHPQTGLLSVYDAVRITVHYDSPSVSGAPAREVEALMADKVADDRASRLFVNYKQVKDLYRVAESAQRSPADTYDYVIVTSSALASFVSASSFVAWKTSLGYSVRTVFTSDAEITGQPGIDLAERIRNFLRAYYGVWGIQYVLIVGDYMMVPMRYGYPDPTDHTHNPGNHTNPGGSVPTDLYYADLSQSDADSWDSDGDGYHGEYLEDNPDFLAEVYVGRIPTNLPNRITYALDKIVAFEQDGGAWKDRALQPGSMLFYENQNYSGYTRNDGSTLLNKIEIDLMGGWTVSRYTERDGLDPSYFPWPAVSMSAFIDDWRTGQYGVVNWSGHGAPYGVARTVWVSDDGDGVMETDGSDVVNQPFMIDAWCSLDDDYPSIVFPVSCNVGYPEPNGYGNLGIDLLTKPGFGAAAGIVCSSRPAYVSGDFIAYPGGAESICYEFNRHGITENQRLGEAMFNAKFYCFQNYGWDAFPEYVNQYNFDLYGDPSMSRNPIPTAVARDRSPGAAPARLLQNVPNPFNPTTEIAYELSADSHVQLEVFDAAGKKVTTLVDGYRRAGKSVVRWDGRNGGGNGLASGVYFYRLRAAGKTITRKMILLK